MKSYSDIKQKTVEQLGTNLFAYRYNHLPIQVEDREQWECEVLYFENPPTRELVINNIMATKYTLEEEIKILYRGTLEEIREHENWVRFAKSIVNEIDIESVILNTSISERLTLTEEATDEIITALNERNIL